MDRLLQRMGVCAAVTAALLVFGPVAPGGSAPGHPLCARAAGENHVAVVFQHGGGGHLGSCAAFSGTDVGAEEALAAAGVEFGTSEAYGGPGYRALCQVDGEPATYPPTCLNQSHYWSLWMKSGNGWLLAPVGISSIRLRDGDWLGLRYVEYHHENPPPLPSAGACAALVEVSPSPTGDPMPVDPLPKPPTPVPSSPGATPGPSPDPTSAATPTSTPTAGPSPGVTASPTRAPAVSPTSASPSGTGGRGTQPPAAGPDPGVLLAAGGGGALLGLLIIQLLVRRRR